MQRFVRFFPLTAVMVRRSQHFPCWALLCRRSAGDAVAPPSLQHRSSDIHLFVPSLRDSIVLFAAYPGLPSWAFLFRP